MKRVRLPINQNAALSADAALERNTYSNPNGATTQSRRDAWINAYAAAGGEVEEVDGKSTSVGQLVKSCPINNIELRYLRADGAPVANAQYVVRSLQGDILYKGSLDANGYALIRNVPYEHTSFVYYFHKDSQPYTVTRGPSARPDEQETQDILDSILDWIWGTLQGDFNENQSTSQIVVNTVLGLIPLVDQALDVRDIIAGIKHLVSFYQEDESQQRKHADVLGLSHELWLWINVFIIAIGCIPELGSAIKGVLKLIINRMQKAGKKIAMLEPHQVREIWEAVVKVLNDYGFGNANKWLMDFSGKLDGWMAEATEKIRHALDATKSMVTFAQNRFNGWLADALLSEAQRTSILTRLQKFQDALSKIYSRLEKMKAEVNAWIREQVSNLISGSHKFEKKGTATSAGGGHVNTRVQEKAPAPDLHNPPLHANNSIKKYWDQWPEAVHRRYMEAQKAVEHSATLVRKMSAAELAAIQGSKKGSTTLQDVFPPGKEGNKAFALGRVYEFKKGERNLQEGYEEILNVRLDGGLREYLLQNMVPDRLPGKMPAEFKDLPRFKLEQDGFTILIPKTAWSVFVKYIH
ncbi:hypothetical protein F0U62_05470 [Cystobacter fuscus]|uniref:hypothetical protein n=1 Tax=Cystobacter fuscus TaxID=43 RepID=UPI002B30C43C|nr:hypothetical protein F0U62_05470 [Cystobacter fuscus]